VRRLLDAGLTQIYGSVDTLDPEIHKVTRGGDLAKVIGNIQTLLRILPPEFKIRIALMNHRDYRLDDAVGKRFTELFALHPNVILNGVLNGLMASAEGDYRISKERTPRNPRPMRPVQARRPKSAPT
jgi:hypothetical protein